MPGPLAPSAARPSDYHSGDREFAPRPDHIPYVDILHEIISTVILSLPLVQVGSSQFLSKDYAFCTG